MVIGGDRDYSDDRYIDLEQEDAVKLRAAFELVFNKMSSDDREAFIESHRRSSAQIIMEW